MTKEEENEALLDAWDKITQWVRNNCRFPKTMKFSLPHDTYHWSKLEVYPSGDCAVLTGTHGNPGAYRPTMVHGREEFRFGNADNEPSWYSREEDFEKWRKYDEWNKPRYFDHVEAFWLLRELYENWGYVKSQVLSAIEANRRLEDFEP